MILTVTPNPALDITYTIPRLEVGGVHRVGTVVEAPGGKGVNVARVLTQLGEAATCTGFLGGSTGRRLASDLDAAGIRQAWVSVDGETRRTVTVVSDDDATMFTEPGPVVDATCWEQLSTRTAELVRAGDALTISGSLPPGTPEHGLGDLVRAVAARGARAVVDTSGHGLRAAADAGAHVLKPNDAELRDATGEEDVVAGARRLLDRGAGSVLVSRGADGLLLLVRGARGVRGWRARPAEILRGNPTGAGDAAVAAVARALTQVGAPLEAVLPACVADAVALSGAAVLAPMAGAVDVAAYERMRTRIVMDEFSPG
ncbi:1-phosphofructokinase family hexose kinase [Georgenia alba]|uniref:1-phosphofructokinase family hexose kinase n=1 Tax=Georgenia alba TaxID=2233858 RepID=A0ABW2Q853_9MICO